MAGKPQAPVLPESPDLCQVADLQNPKFVLMDKEHGVKKEHTDRLKSDLIIQGRSPGAFVDTPHQREQSQGTLAQPVALVEKSSNPCWAQKQVGCERKAGVLGVGRAGREPPSMMLRPR